MKNEKNIGENRGFSGLTGQNMHSVRLERKRNAPLKYLISDEIQALLASIQDPRDLAIFRLAYHHGLRASEIRGIQMRDYRPSSRMEYDRLTINRLKGSLGGDTILVPAAALAIRRWVKKRGMASGAMFPSKKKTPISRQRLDELMKHYARLAGIPPEKAHFHTLKHSCATMLLSDRKESIVDVQHHLGHADIRSTMVYAKLTQQANEERAVRLRDWK